MDAPVYGRCVPLWTLRPLGGADARGIWVWQLAQAQQYEYVDTASAVCLCFLAAGHSRYLMQCAAIEYAPMQCAEKEYAPMQCEGLREGHEPGCAATATSDRVCA
eukprot:2444191-Rhodomonas_salina.1